MAKSNIGFHGWKWSIFLLFLSLIPGICHSEVVTSLKESQGSDTVFSLDSKIGSDTKRIMWISTSKHLILANSSAGESSPDWIINSKEYKGRLSLLPDKSLMLSNLKTEDSGCYEADIKSFLGVIITQKFNLTVFESDNTEPKMNLQNHSHYFAIFSLVVFLLIPCVCYLKRRGSQRRGELHTEENGHSQMASPQTNEESLRMLKTSLVTTIQEDVVGMRNGVGTQQENSRDQHR
ncbi:uncharacterized protein ACOB8E_000068 isoform 1-T1 [Sarcophilus harrisii]